MAKRFRIELGFLGLIFVFLLLVCLFLWMFILGVWFGQRMVGKGPSPVAEKTLKEKIPEELPAEEVSPPPGVLSPERPPAVQPPGRPSSGKPAPRAPSKPESVSQEKPVVAPKMASPESETSPAPKPSSYFTLQVASFRDSGEAERYARLFRERGYAARVVKVELPGKGTWYRVYVGRFGSKVEAEQAYRKLKARKLVDKAYIKKINR